MYASAGADGIFVPGMDVEDVAPFAGTVTPPLNVYAGGGSPPPVHVLRRAGARRVSLGCGPLQSVFGSLRGIAKKAFIDGSFDDMNASMPSVSEVNDLFVPAAIGFSS